MPADLSRERLWVRATTAARGVRCRVKVEKGERMDAEVTPEQALRVFSNFLAGSSRKIELDCRWRS